MKIPLHMFPEDIQAVVLILAELRRRDQVWEAIGELLDRNELPPDVVAALPDFARRERHDLHQLGNAARRLLAGDAAAGNA